jgi:integrase
VKLRLTELVVQRLKPPASGRLEAYDALVPSFGLRISASGVRSYFCVGRVRGSKQLRRFTLGRVGTVTLGEAREKARTILADLASGVDPEVAARRRQVVTVRGAVADYAARRLNGLRSATATRQLLEREFVARFGDMSIRAITRQDILRMVEDVAASRPAQANRLLANLRRLLQWCTERGDLESSPAVLIRPPARERPRERVLSDQELAAVWRSCSGPFGVVVMLLMLTASRRDEIADATWEDLDLGQAILVVPEHRHKSSRRHEILLPSAAVEILSTGIRSSGRLFPVFNWNREKRKLDKRGGVRDWVLHDIRRSVVSNLAKAGAPPGVLARVLGHSASAAQGSLLAIYARHEFTAEARAAIEAWGRELMRLTGETESKVIRLK